MTRSCPAIPSVRGKGEVLWRSLAATTGDLICFVDADLKSFSSTVVTGVLGPLLSDPDIHLVKAMYDRPLVAGSAVLPAGGGRVTELVARPILNLHWPLLAGFVQPLGGEYAARRSLLERLPFPTGYGVETAMLIDTLALVGLDGMAQVDVGVRLHHHQDDAGSGPDGQRDHAGRVGAAAARRPDSARRGRRPSAHADDAVPPRGRGVRAALDRRHGGGAAAYADADPGSGRSSDTV